MKKTILLCIFLIASIQIVSAQPNKTNLSLQVSAASTANRAQLANYVWQRTVQVFVGGELKNTIVSAMNIGADGKIIATSTTSTPAKSLPGGIRGDIARKKIAETKTYVDNAIKLSMDYLYLNKGKMVNFFDASSIVQSGNTLTVKGSNVDQATDQLTMVLSRGTLAYISQTFSSTMTNGDAITGTLNYQTFSNGLTAINNGELDLPAKSMKLMITNSNYAKKLH